ncbi:MAG: tRNA epoxyqueuosine(34) reductase QueG [Firmicutes bacterium]|nr:tRNA epoxyqueuosine(34) reductase QueG [Bacillota bacterium]
MAIELDLKQFIKDQARALGFCGAGFAGARLGSEYTRRLQVAIRPPYVRWEPEARTNAASLLPGARSVLALAFPYRERMGLQLPAPGQGYFSPFAQAPDYHSLVGEKIEALISKISQQLPDLRSAYQVDNGPCSERVWALAAGVGWQGKNNFIIVPDAGSFVWLGLLALDIPLEPDQPLASACGDCTRCLEACPTNAYPEANRFLWPRCMAYWTTDKGELSEGQCRMLSRHQIVYGCDYCQLACPHNLVHGEPGTVELAPLFDISAAEFRRQFGDTAFWRGRRVLRRNARIAAGQPPGTFLIG